MQLTDGVFFVFAFMTLASGCVVVLSRNMIHAAFSLLFTLFGVAGLYVLLMADFLAVTQIVIYVGGILVLLLFGVMLTSRVITVDIRAGALHTVPALFIVAVVAGSLSGMFYSTWRGVQAPADVPLPTTPPIGKLLMTSYLLPFEVVSVVLLAALIGAALIARKGGRP
ncbi:MAG: NADH-quinone oxidoreductase subunit J [Bacteroidota bacterium]